MNEGVQGGIADTLTDYGCTSRSTPKVHPKYTMSIVLILIVLSVISSKKVYLCTFFEKSFQ